MYLPPISTFITYDPLAMVYDQLPPSLMLSDSTLLKMIQDTLVHSRLTVTRIEPLPNHLHRICSVHLSNGSQAILKLNPSSSTDLLRHEQHFLETEAIVLTLLTQSNLPISRPLRYDKSCSRLDSPFLLSTHLPGVSYADAKPYITPTERKEIELRLRSFSSVISQHRSSTFGPVALVSINAGASSWRGAFKRMVESVLMDGEDSMTHLPYAEIREAVSIWGEALDEVKEARLVVVGLGKPENVLLHRKTNDVLGLLDFGHAVWGDTAISEPELCPGTRGLLYTCYDAIVTIVTNHYRPQREARELDARKILTKTLTELAVEKRRT